MGEKIGLKMREQDGKARGRRLFLEYVTLGKMYRETKTTF